MDKQQSPSAGSLQRTSGTKDTSVILAWAQRWLSPARLEPYLAACNGDIEQALELHEWNILLGHALLVDIAHLELALRNAYVRILHQDCGERWLFDDASPIRVPILRMSKAKKIRDVNLVNRRAIDDARMRAHDENNPDQVTAGLTLGFWVHLTDRNRERELWIPHLYKAWPTGTDRSGINLRLAAVNEARNRIAHNERLFNPKNSMLSPMAVDADTIRLLHDLCPEACNRFHPDGRTNVELFLEKNPAPAEVKL